MIKKISLKVINQYFVSECRATSLSRGQALNKSQEAREKIYYIRRKEISIVFKQACITDILVINVKYISDSH